MAARARQARTATPGAFGIMVHVHRFQSSRVKPQVLPSVVGPCSDDILRIVFLIEGIVWSLLKPALMVNTYDLALAVYGGSECASFHSWSLC